jgi:hypothetical protein
MENKLLRIASIGTVVIPNVFSGIYRRESLSAKEWERLIPKK